MPSDKFKSILHFHGIVFIFGFTAILGKLISIDAVSLVWYRMVLATAVLTLFVLAFMKANTNRVSTAVANTIRYQTNDTASIEMSFPKIAVNPKIKTIP